MSDQQETTLDYLFQDIISIEQPAKGFRFGIDAILLAASVASTKKINILDVGCGVGTVSLALAQRIEECRIMGIDKQHPYVRLASKNIKENLFQHKIEVLWAEIEKPPPRLAAASYDVVVTNPPFFEPNNARPSPQELKARANHFTAEMNLAKWLNFCLLMLKSKGFCYLILPAKDLGNVISILHAKAGWCEVFPIFSKSGQPASRVIIKCQKNIKGDDILYQGLVIHNADGSYTNEAAKVIHGGKALAIGQDQ